MNDMIQRIAGSIGKVVWGPSLDSLPRHRRAVAKFLRITHMLLRELVSGSFTLRAASLVFTSLLSLVPLLAVSFSLLKAFGVVQDKLESALVQLLAPLGDQGVEFSHRIVTFVDQVKVGVLGGIGLVILMVTVVSLVQKVEEALNVTWRVRHPRNLAQRFSGYLSVLLVGPLLVFAAIGLIGTILSTPLVQSLSQVEPFGTLLALVPKLLPYGLMIVAFTFVYAFIPNTRVNMSSALVGGTVAGVLWATAGWAFGSFIVKSPESSYAAIYSSFAIVFFFMLWLYVAWLIVLVGGTVAFYHQNPHYLGVMPGELVASNQLRERIALAAMLRIGRRYLAGKPPLDATALSREMRLPGVLLEDTLDFLRDDGFLVQVDAPGAGFLPGRDMSRIRLVDLLASVRRAHDHRQLAPDNLPREPVAETLMRELEESAAAVLAARTLRELIEEEVGVETVLDEDADEAAPSPDAAAGGGVAVGD